MERCARTDRRSGDRADRSRDRGGIARDPARRRLRPRDCRAQALLRPDRSEAALVTANDGPTPIRRSPLAERHRALGARFGDSGEWPTTYGDVQRERRAVKERVALNDW